MHPGYGFLSENAAFARAVQEAGLTWIGPPPAAIEAMGSKVEAKRLMAAAGVPVLPSSTPDAPDRATTCRCWSRRRPAAAAAACGSSARSAELPAELDGGPVRGRVRVRRPDSVLRALPRAGRHIEVQILADDHGTIWTVGERECSIQRRHQKIIEEAPSPLVQRLPGMRERLFDAARAAAAAVGYRGAGTVEFLADEERPLLLPGDEHPAPGRAPGHRVHDRARPGRAAAADRGRAPAAAAAPPPVTGHAIEVRLYAEDPAAGWQPQSGTLHTFELPGPPAEFDVPSTCTRCGPAGCGSTPASRAAAEVGIHYDPMLAKVICWAPTGTRRPRRLAAALRRARIHGLTTNRDLLVDVLRHPAFLAGQTDTGVLRARTA